MLVLRKSDYEELLSGLDPFEGAIEFDSMCEGTDFDNHEENLAAFVKMIPNIPDKFWKFIFGDIYESIIFVWKQKYVHAKYLRSKNEPNALHNRLRLLPTNFATYIIEVNVLTIADLDHIEIFAEAIRIIIKYYSYADTEVASKMYLMQSGNSGKYKFVYKQSSDEK